MKFQNVNLTKLYIRWGYLFMGHKQSPQSCECVFCLSRQMFLQGRIAEQSQYLQTEFQKNLLVIGQEIYIISFMR